MNVRVNPLIRFVWAGFALLMLGVAIAALGRRMPKKAGEPEELPEGDAKTADVSEQDGAGQAKSGSIAKKEAADACDTFVKDSL